MGTPSYMAPEQAEGKTQAIGRAVDIYALGAILYEMLTGRPPFRGETTLDTLEQVRLQEPLSPRRLQPKVPRDLETVCLKCLEKDPHRRYAAAAELADDLRRFLTGEAVRARPTAVWERGVKWARRQPALAALVVVSMAAVMSLLGMGIGFTAQLRAERDLARQEQLRAEKQELIAREQRVEADQQRARAQAILRMACATVDENAWAAVNSKAEARAEPAPGTILYKLACVYALTSASTRLEPTLNEDDRQQLAEQYAARAVQLLVNAQSLGYFSDPVKRERFKQDRDLDPLRSRADFKKLQAGLEKPAPRADAS
jgi:hypothetical protein